MLHHRRILSHSVSAIAPTDHHTHTLKRSLATAWKSTVAPADMEIDSATAATLSGEAGGAGVPMPPPLPPSPIDGAGAPAPPPMPSKEEAPSSVAGVPPPMPAATQNGAAPMDEGKEAAAAAEKRPLEEAGGNGEAAPAADQPPRKKVSE